MGFTEEYNKWLDYHIRSRSGERKSRLQRGHGHGERVFIERVWWQIFGNLDNLHPEYEVLDWQYQLNSKSNKHVLYKYFLSLELNYFYNY